VQDLLGIADPLAELATSRGQAQRQEASVLWVGVALDQSLRDQAINQPARAVPGLADQQATQGAQRERTVVPEYPDHLALRRRHPERPQLSS
jgi:hypothetical protein